MYIDKDEAVNRDYDKTIGIIGGGQLGRMMMPAILELGYQAIVVDSTEKSPAQQFGARQILAKLDNESAIRQLAQLCGTVTWEIEHIPAALLQQLAKEGAVEINPSPDTLLMIQDKYKQKIFLDNLDVPVADFRAVHTKEDILAAGEEFGYPFLLKARKGGYDGRGNALIEKPEDIDAAMQKFGDIHLYAERYVPFVQELAVISARSINGEVASYAPVETKHKENMCEIVISPGRFSDETKEKAIQVAKKVMDAVQGAGVFAFEMFVLEDGSVLVNEIAPRVHNSGHITMDVARTDQFEQHVRAVTGNSLGSTQLIEHAGVMFNIIGDRDGVSMDDVNFQGREAILDAGGKVYWYGKRPAKKRRKMGHANFVGTDVEEILERGQEAMKKVSV